VGADLQAEKAWEAGYFPDFPADGPPPSANDLFQALADEQAGRPRYPRPKDMEAQARYEGRTQDEERAARGIETHPEDLAGPEDYTGAAPPPEYEPAYQEAPTAASWDAVKKRVDELVERDPITNKVIRTGDVGIRNRDIETAANDLRRALVGDETKPGAIPGYREALAKGGDAPRIEAAFNRAKGKLTRGSTRDFGKLMASLKTEWEHEAVKAALANDVRELWGRGLLKGGKFAIPGVREKLELAFGKKAAESFIRKAEIEAELAASGARAAPYGGSPTMTLNEAAEAQDAAAGPVRHLARIGSKFASGNIGGGLADAAITTAGQITARARTAGMSEGMRDEYGRILQMTPDEFAAFLAKWEDLPEAVRRRFPVPAGLMAGQLAGQAAAARQAER
jgi:hypothetical protein